MALMCWGCVSVPALSVRDLGFNPLHHIHSTHRKEKKNRYLILSTKVVLILIIDSTIANEVLSKGLFDTLDQCSRGRDVKDRVM